jgi:hypothetical protein
MPSPTRTYQPDTVQQLATDVLERVMKKICLAVTFVVIGCDAPATKTTRAVLDLDYASTSLGYRNSGALSAGRLFLWDQVDGTLVSLQSGIQLSTLQPTNPVKLEASSVQGVTVSASIGLTQEVEAEVASEVRSKVSFEVNDGVRLNSTRIYDGLSAAYRELSASGTNAYAAWRVEDATKNPERYKYVLLVDEVQASSEVLTYNNTETNRLSFRVVDAFNGEVLVESPSDSTAKCSGQKVVCYVNVSVLRAFINPNGGLDYSPSAFDRSQLVKAFRSL